MEIVGGIDTDASRSGGLQQDGLRQSPRKYFGEETISDAPEDEGLLEQGIDMAGGAFWGMVEGFTTLPVTERPEDTGEAIAQNLGQLIGFIGVVPGVGSLGSGLAKGTGLALRGVSKALKAGAKWGKIGSKGEKAAQAIRNSDTVRSGLSQIAQLPSVPMMAGEGAVKAAKKVASTRGAKAAAKFMSRSPAVKHMTREGLRMGTAMTASATPRSLIDEPTWEDSADRIMSSFAHGALLGGASAGLGVLFPGTAKGVQQGTQAATRANTRGFPGRQNVFAQLSRGGKPAKHAVARSLSSSIFEGMYSAYRNDPVELQVYNYLLGAYFGLREVSPAQHRAMTKMRNFRREHPGPEGRLAMMDPENLPYWNDLSPAGKAETKVEAELRYSRMYNVGGRDEVDAPDDLGAVNPSEVTLAQAIDEADTKREAFAKAVRAETDQRLRDEGLEDIDVSALGDEEQTRAQQTANEVIEQVKKGFAAKARRDLGIEAPQGSSEQQHLIQPNWPSPGELRVESVEVPEAQQQLTRDAMGTLREMEEAFETHERSQPMRRDLDRLAQEIDDLRPEGEAGPTPTQLQSDLAPLAADALETHGREGFGVFIDQVEREMLGKGDRSVVQDLEDAELRALADADSELAKTAQGELAVRSAEGEDPLADDLPRRPPRDDFAPGEQTIPRDGEAYKALRRTWIRMSEQQKETRRNFSVEEDGLVNASEVSPEGDRVIRQRPASRLERLAQAEVTRVGLEDRYGGSERIAVEQVEAATLSDRQEQVLDNLRDEEREVIEAERNGDISTERMEEEIARINEQRENIEQNPNGPVKSRPILEAREREKAGAEAAIGKVIDRLEREGYAVAGGSKDNSRMVGIPYLVSRAGDTDDPRPDVLDYTEQKRQTLDEIIAEHNATPGAHNDGVPRETDPSLDLMQVKGLGKEKANQLAEAFGSAAEVFQQDAETLQRRVEALGEDVAQNIAERSLEDVVPITREARNEGLERFKERFRDGDGDLVLGESRIEELYDRNQAHSMRMLELLNGGKPIEEIVRSELEVRRSETTEEDRYILDPVAFNKRMQLFDAAEPRFHPGEISARVDDVGGIERKPETVEVPQRAVDVMREEGFGDETIARLWQAHQSGQELQTVIDRAVTKGETDAVPTNQTAFLDFLRTAIDSERGDEGFQNVEELATGEVRREGDATLRGSIIDDFQAEMKGAEALQGVRLDDEGTLEEYRHDSHTDGIMLLRDDVFDAVAETMGLPEGADSHKGVTVSPGDGQEGALLGKYAYHRAGEDLSQHLRESEQHFHLYKTAAKQHGDRGLRGMTVTEDGTVEYRGVGKAGGKDEVDRVNELLDFLERVGNQDEALLDEFENAEAVREAANEARLELGDRLYSKDELRPNSPNLDSRLQDRRDLLERESRIGASALGSEQSNVSVTDPQAPRDELTRDVFPEETPSIGENVDPGPTEVPVEHMTANLSNGEDPSSSLKDQPAMSQLHTSLSEAQGGEAALRAFEQIMREKHEGDTDENAKVQRFKELRAARRKADSDAETQRLDNRIQELIEGLDVDKLGNQQILDILVNDAGEANPLFAKVAEDIIAKDRRGEVSFLDPAEDPQQTRRRIENAELKGAANRILENWPMTPATLGYKRVGKYAESVIRNYIVDRTLKPTMPHSWKSILTPQDPHTRAKIRASLGRDLRRDEFVLHGGLKEKTIRWEEEGPRSEVTMEEAWAEFQDEGGWGEAPEWMQDRLEMAAIRVPADSISGTRTLKFQGFLDDMGQANKTGTGAIVHPRAMEYIGGADLDIDKVRVYQDLPQEMMSAFRQHQTQWERRVTHKGQERWALEPVKQNKDAFKVEEAGRFRASPGALFNLADRIAAGEGAYEGNQILGVALNAANNFHLMAEQMGGGRRVGTTRTGEITGETYLPDDVLARLQEAGYVPENAQNVAWTARVTDDLERLRELKRDAVNYAADAANVASLIDKFETPALMGRAALEDIKLAYETEDGRARTANIDLDTLQKAGWSPTQLNPYQKLAAARRLTKGYNYKKEQAFTLEEVIEGASWKNPGLRPLRQEGALPDDIPGTFFRGARMLGGLNIEDTVRKLSHGGVTTGVPKEMGENYLEFKEAFDRLMKRDDPISNLMLRFASRAAPGMGEGDTRTGLVTFSERRDKSGGEPERFAAESDQPRPPARDRAVNDMTDITTTMLLYRKARQIPESGEKPQQVASRLEEIAKTVTAFRRAEKEQRNVLDEEKINLREYQSRQEGLSEIRNKLRQWYEGLEDKYKPWAETYMLGSLYPQEQGFDAHAEVQQIRGQLRDLEAKHNEIKKLEPDHPDREKHDRLTTTLKQRMNEWYKTDPATSFFVTSDVIPPQAVEEFGRAYNDLVQRTHTDNFTADDIETIMRDHELGGGRYLESLVPGASRMNKQVKKKAEAQTFLERYDKLLEVDESIIDDPDFQNLKDRLTRVFDHYPHLIEEIDDIFRGLTAQMGTRQNEKGLTPRTATKQDLEDFVSFLERQVEHKGMTGGEEGRPLRWYHYYWWQPAIDKELVPWDQRRVDSKAPILSIVDNEMRDGALEAADGRFGSVRQLFSTHGLIHKIHRRSQEWNNKAETRLAQRMDEMIGWKDALDGDGDDLFEIAVRQREARGDDVDSYYYNHAQDAEEALRTEFAGKQYQVNLPGDSEQHTLTAREVVREIDQRLTQWSEEVYQRYVYNEEARQEWLEDYINPDATGEHHAQTGGRIDVRAFAEDYADQLFRFRGFHDFPGAIEEPPPMEVLFEVTRQMMLDKTKVEMPPLSDEAHYKLSTYLQRENGDPTPTLEAIKSTPQYEAVRNEEEAALSDIPDSVVDLLRVVREGEGETVRLRDLDDPLRGEIEERLVRQYPDQLGLELRRDNPEKRVDPERYFPHNGHTNSAMQDAKQRRMEELRAEGADPVRVAEEEVQAEIELARSQSDDLGVSAAVSDLFMNARINQDDLETGGLNYKPSHLMRRGSQSEEGGPLPGYDVTEQALQRYERQMQQAQTNLWNAVLSHEMISRFEEERPLGEFTEQWGTFMRIYMRDQQGLPGMLPEEWLQKLGGSVGPYWMFTDESLTNAVDTIAETMGWEGDYLPDEATREQRRQLRGKRWQHNLKQFSKLEGQWQLMTLLAHTKTAANNIFGGSMNSAISAGWQPLKTAFTKGFSTKSLQRLRNKIDATKQTASEFREMAYNLGATEGFMNEFRMKDWEEATKLRNFGREIREKMAKDPEMDDSTIERIGKSEFGLWARASTEQWWNKLTDAGGWFMRKSERKLRADSWLAHYLKARDTLWMNGQTFRNDHPWLIDMANRGVEASQFLYNQAERPAFARTNWGRVFSRFQLWSWNSIRFRKNVLQEASRRGFQPGTESFNRFRRMMTADMFIMGLGSILPWSMFGATIPPPYDQFKSLATFFFGDSEEDREQAFYGKDYGIFNVIGKPSQIVQPPAARPLDSMFRMMVSNDPQKVAGEFISNSIPFGRLGVDMAQSVQAPAVAFERMIGLPTTTLTPNVERAAESGSSAAAQRDAVPLPRLFETEQGQPASPQQLPSGTPEPSFERP